MLFFLWKHQFQVLCVCGLYLAATNMKLTFMLY